MKAANVNRGRAPRLYVACIRCIWTDDSPAAVGESIAYYLTQSDEPPLLREPNGDYVTYDLCPDCREIWAKGDDLEEGFPEGGATP